jgi:oligosaccharide repeat unit polymerase
VKTRAETCAVSYPRGGDLGQGLLFLSCIAWILGIFTLSGLEYLTSIYFTVAYSTLIAVILSCAWFSRDWLHPLVLVLLVGFIRFSITGFMTWMDMDSKLRIFDLMGITSEDWMRGHMLALMGLLGVVTGWHLNLRLPASTVQRLENWTHRYSRGLPLAAMLCMLIGLAALYMFVSSNTSFQEAVLSGEMRGTEIQEGTGKYYRLSFLLIAGSVVFSVYLADGGRSWWMALIPSIVAAAAMAILGGRTLASMPLAATWIALWSRKHMPQTTMKMAMLGGLFLVPVYSYLGQVYRGGSGVEGITAEAFSVASVIQYLEYSIWLDWGHLHSMAAAVMIGPGVLGGQTFTVLLWPLSKLLGLSGRSAGVFMVDTLLPDYHPVSRGKWGFHATLIGDAYLNFGAMGVIVATAIFGIVLHIAYTQVKERLSNAAFYGLAIICCLQIFYISVESAADIFLMLGFAVFVVQLGKFFEVPALAQHNAPYVAKSAKLRAARFKSTLESNS